MKRISIFLLSLVFVLIPLNPAMAEQDYLDKRWAKTGCKPLNEQTKNSLIVTDVVLDPDETGVVRNIQKLYFQRNNSVSNMGEVAQNNPKESRINTSWVK